MDRFTKVKKIGEGSFGKALLVKSKADGQQYVVKEISISKMQTKERQEARKEVSVLSKMKHPNIVQYIESFEENGCLYIVMEYCEGGDLYARINSQQGMAFSESKVLDWFVQICLALKHVHDRKILHRDIKTSNIFLTKSGAIKLGDFGIARVLNNTMELARTCIGTPYYLSPEICENKPYNNKSDVWALGCVLYEVLTLKHAFEAGNMKNLVLKIIRGSYPPVPTRYSHDLRGLVSQLFRRSPRDRPSVNSILKKPFIYRHTEKFLTPQQYEEEFSHTVLHRNRKPCQARPQSAVAASGIRRKPEPRPASAMKSPTNDRAKQLAVVYGNPLAVKKPSSAASRFQKYAEHQKKAAAELDKRKQQFLEEEKKRREVNEKKRQEEIAARQMDRADRIRAQQIRRARDNAREMNLKRSVEMFEPPAGKKGVDENKKPVAKEQKMAPAKMPRPTSAPNARPQNYEKYHQYLDRLREGDRREAANVASPYLAQVKAAWEDRVSAQNAVMDAIGNKVEGRMAAERARVIQEYMQRKQENVERNQGMIKIHNDDYKGQGVAAALQPFNAYQPKPSNNDNFEMRARNKDEAEYLARLRQIRIQNFNERRALKERQRGNQGVGVAESLEAQIRRQKVEALQKQAEERVKALAENAEQRKQDVNKMFEEAVNKKYEEKATKKLEEKKVLEEKARARGILPPDERPVVFLPKPIGITQALNAVGIDKFKSQSSEPDVGVLDGKIEPQQSVEGSPAPDKKRQILKRVNEKFLPNDENESEKSPEAGAPGNSQVQHQWAAGDIGQKLAALPLQETASQMEATGYKDVVIMNQAKAIVAKRGWNQPSSTVVNKLNQMSLCDATAITLSEDTKQMIEVPENNNNKEIGHDSSTPTIKTRVIASAQRQPQPALKFSVKFDEAKRSRLPHLGQQPNEGLKIADNAKPVSRVNKGTVVLGDVSVALLDDTPVIDPVMPEKHPLPQVPKKSLVAALAAKFNAGDAYCKGTFVSHDASEMISDENNDQAADKSISPTLKCISDNKKAIQGDENVEEIKLDDCLDINKAIPSKSAVEAWSSSPTKCDGPLRRGSGDQTSSSSQSSPSKTISPTTQAVSVQDPGSSTANSIKSVTHRISAPSPPKRSAEGPLFSKVQNSPVTASSLPITSEKTDSDSTPTNNLCKTMFSTASEEMVMKLTLGHFDSPNPKLLRTCSMPDLLKSIPEEEEDMIVTKNSPVRLSAGNLDGESVRSSGSQSSRSSSPGENKATMNDTNFDDGEINPSSSQDVAERLLGDSEDEDEEDMASLRANLQNVLLEEESDLKGFTSDESDDEGSVNTDDSWSDESFEEEDDNRKANSDTESVFSRLEQNREELERQLGIENFLKIYKAVQAMHENEDEEMKVGEARIRELLGEKQGLYNRVLQLVMADGAYCEDNN